MDRSKARRIAVGIFFLILAGYMLTYVGAFKVNDERAMFAGADSFLKRGEFTTNQIYWDYTNVGMLTTSGEMVPNYEPAQMVLSIPFYLWGRALDAAVQGVMFFSLVTTALSATLLYLCVIELGYDRRTGALAALVYAFGTIAWAYSKTFYRDPLAVMAYLLAIYALLRYRPPAPRGWKWPAVAGAALGLALTTKQVSVALLPSLLLLVLVYERGRPGGGGERFRAAVAALLPLLIILGLGQLYYVQTLSGIETFARDISDSITNPQLSSSEPLRMVRAALGLTVSPFRGIFWYAPVLLLALVGAIPFMRRHPWEGVAFGLIFGGHLLGYSRYLHWAGGMAWGSRYMLGTIPFLLLLALPVLDWFLHVGGRSGWKARGGRAIIALLITLSVLIQLLGVSFDMRAYENDRYLAVQARIYGGYGEAIDATYMMPRFSPVFGNLRLLLEGEEPLDVAWVQRRPEGSRALLPGALALLFLNLGLAVIGLLWLWRQPRLSRPLAGGLGLATLAIASLLLLLYREGDARFDPYNVARFLPPMIERLEQEDCGGEPSRCDAVMITSVPVTDYFLTHLRSPLPWYALPEQPDEADFRLLEQLVQRYPTIWLVRYQSAQADDEQGLRSVERWLTEHAYKVEEQQVEGWARLIRFSAAGEPAEARAVDEPLGEMQLEAIELGVQADHSVPPRAGSVRWEARGPLADGVVKASTGEILQVGLHWRATEVPETNYTVFVQLIDGTPQVLLQRDRWPGDGLFPTATLDAGERITDTLALSLDVPPGNYRLITGMYRNDVEGAPRLVGPGGDFVHLADIVVE